MKNDIKNWGEKKMDREIYEYIKNGITITGNPIEGYTIFTIPTQHFKIDSLEQLTPQTFKDAIVKQIGYEKLSSELWSELNQEIQNVIDNNILNILRGGEPNPDIIPFGVTPFAVFDRIYKNYYNEISSNKNMNFDVPLSKEEFINKLKIDDEFYKQWGEDSCVELTNNERYEKWFRNNYETGMEFNSEIVPDFDNDYYEPTPKRKFKK